jgi:hypothetical protein
MDRSDRRRQLLSYLLLCCGFAVALEKVPLIALMSLHAYNCLYHTYRHEPALGHYHIVGISTRNEVHVYA